jgi:2-polyprenyl-3-methyl-5-hydroxy-6-metoxy-1,4-benzoquinol methylase
MQKSKWTEVADFMKEAAPVALGSEMSYQYQSNPKNILSSLSYYKFAAKLIGKNKNILDIGCGEGLGTFLLAKECGFAHGIDLDSNAIKIAKQNFFDANIAFTVKEIFKDGFSENFDAVIHFTGIEQVCSENALKFFYFLQKAIRPHGLCIVGTPFPEKLKNMMPLFFEHVFLFSANDEVIQAGILPFASYFLAVGCGTKTNFLTHLTQKSNFLERAR